MKDLSHRTCLLPSVNYEVGEITAIAHFVVQDFLSKNAMAIFVCVALS